MDTLVPGPTQSKSFIAQRRHLAQELAILKREGGKLERLTSLSTG